MTGPYSGCISGELDGNESRHVTASNRSTLHGGGGLTPETLGTLADPENWRLIFIHVLLIIGNRGHGHRLTGNIHHLTLSNSLSESVQFSVHFSVMNEEDILELIEQYGFVRGRLSCKQDPYCTVSPGLATTVQTLLELERKLSDEAIEDWYQRKAQNLPTSLNGPKFLQALRYGLMALELEAVEWAHLSCKFDT